MVVLLFCLRDFEAVLGSPNGALLEIYYQVLANRAGVRPQVYFPLTPGNVFAHVQPRVNVLLRPGGQYRESYSITL